MMSGIFGMPPAAGIAAGFWEWEWEWEWGNGDVSGDCGLVGYARKTPTKR